MQVTVETQGLRTGDHTGQLASLAETTTKRSAFVIVWLLREMPEPGHPVREDVYSAHNFGD